MGCVRAARLLPGLPAGLRPYQPLRLRHQCPPLAQVLPGSAPRQPDSTPTSL